MSKYDLNIIFVEVVELLFEFNLDFELLQEKRIPIKPLTNL